MTNKEAIELLRPLTGYSVSENGIGTFPMVSTPLQAEALDLAIKALEEKSWIPTSEMLPEEYDDYIVMWRRRDGKYPDRLFYEMCLYNPEEGEWDKIEQAGEKGAEIMAWMPLPEKYEPI